MSDISKSNAVKLFYESYRILSEKDKESFSKLCDKLLNENFIYGQISSDENDYYNILRFQNIINNYFSLIDFEVQHDDTYKILYLESKEGRNRVHLKKLETVLLILLRRFYYLKSKEEIASNTNIVITFEELVDSLNQTGIYKEKYNKTALLASLKTLKKFKVINADLQNFEVNNVIEIYPTISHIVNIHDVDLINAKLKAYIGKEGDEEDETCED